MSHRHAFAAASNWLYVIVLALSAGAPACAGGGMILPQPEEVDDGPGFVSIFDGKTLRGWEGDPRYWHVEGRSIVGETTSEFDQPEGTFLIWRGGVLRDFDLRLEYRVSRSGKSGVFYRAIEPHYRKWLLGGYQCAIDGPDWSKAIAAYLEAKTGVKISARDLHGSMPRLTGQSFEEVWSETPPRSTREPWLGMPPGRQLLSMPGQITDIPEGQRQRVIGNVLGGTPVADIATDGWNELRVLARGGVMIHILNGRVVSVVVDDDVERRRLEGKLGLQLHPGPPMKVEFRNIRLKTG